MSVPSENNETSPSSQPHPRLQRLQRQQKRTERLNYVAILIACLLGVYILVTIVRPLVFGHRPGQLKQELGCVSKSSLGAC